MKVWITQTSEPYPFEEGVRKWRTGILADYLVSLGHEVIWWGCNFTHQKKKLLYPGYKEVAVSKNYRLKLLRGFSYKRNVSLIRYLCYKRVAFQFKQYSLDEEVPDLLIGNLPSYDIAYEAVKYAVRRNIPIIVDARDPFPDAYLKVIPKLFGRLAALILALDRAKVKFVLKNSDSIVSLSEQMMLWAQSYLGRTEPRHVDDKIFYVGYKKTNTDMSKVSTELIDVMQTLYGKFIATFIGIFGKSINFDAIVQCAKILKENGVFNVQIVLGGAGDNYDLVKRRVAGMNNVTILGWVNADEVKYVMEGSHAGLAPYNKNSHQTLPNKIFEYMAYGLPVISTLPGEVCDILKENNCGYGISSNPGRELAIAIADLANDKTKWEVMSQNSRELHSSKFDADKIYGEYVNHLDHIMKRPVFRKKL